MGSVLVHVSGAVGGDARPALAVAWALQARGHDVVVLSDARTTATVAALGLPAASLPDDATWGVARRQAEPPPAPTGSRPDLDAADARHLQVLHDWSRAVAPVVAETARQHGASLLVGSLVGLPPVTMAAAQLDVRVAAVNPTFVFGRHGARQIAEDVARPFRGTYGDYLAPLLDGAAAVVHATGSAFDPVTTPPPNGRLVGALRWDAGLPPMPTWRAAAGPPWVIVAMPSIPLHGDVDVARAAVTALAERPVRTLVLLHGRQPGLLGPLPDNAGVVADLPRWDALAGAALCVAPASHGTVMAALHNGVPLVVLPWTADQLGVAWRVSLSGSGVTVVPDGDVAGSTTDAVERVLDDGRYRDDAVRLQEALTGEPPAAAATAAADLLEPLI